jgi:flavin-dependent dehydrogenase
MEEFPMANKSTPKTYDVIIVGAGPAGCSAAEFIAQQGHSVLLLEKSCFPRDKICGDGISGPSLSILRRIGVLDTIKKSNPWNIQNVVLSSPSGAWFKAHVPYKDEGSLIDPLSGEGIFYALKSGEYAAQAMNTALSDKRLNRHAGKIYERLWKKGFKWKEYVPGFICQTFFNRQWILDLGIERAGKNAKKAQTLAGVIGHNLSNQSCFLISSGLSRQNARLAQ